MALKIDSRISLKNGDKIPLLGLGTWKLDGKDAENAVYNALKDGYRHIDTAKIYGNEEEVGNGIRKAMKDFKIKRSEIFVTTKLFNSDHFDIPRAFNDSFNKLGIEYIDLYLMHWPVPVRLSSWKKMQELLKDGRCKALGVSNFTIEHLQQLIDNKLPIPVVNQVEFSPFLYQKDLLDFCNKHKIALEAYSPLTHGERINDEKISEIAKKYNKTSAQILLRWCLEHNIVALPKSGHEGRIKENSMLYDFNIKKEDMEKLDGLNEDFRTCWNPKNAPLFMSIFTMLGLYPLVARFIK